MTNLSSALLPRVRGALAAGDLILTNGVLGTVHEINARTVVLDTSDGWRLHVPDSHVLGGTIENYSSSATADRPSTSCSTARRTSIGWMGWRTRSVVRSAR
jgi:hypothetical protein